MIRSSFIEPYFAMPSRGGWVPQKSDFRPFYLEDNFTPSCTCFILGKRGAGKTTVLRSICRHLYDYGYNDGSRPDLVIGFSDSEDFNSNMGEFVPTGLIFDDISEATLARIFAMQKAFQQKYGRTQNILVLSDDTGFDAQAFKKKMFRKLMQNGRQINVCVIQVLQDCKSIPPGVRSNIDFCFSLYSPSQEERKRLKEGFFGVFRTQWLFDEAFEMLTENNSCIVAKNFAVKSHRLSDQIFHYHAPKHVKPCKLGRKAYWKLSDYCLKAGVGRSTEALMQLPCDMEKKGKGGTGGGSGGGTVDNPEGFFRKVSAEEDRTRRSLERKERRRQKEKEREKKREKERSRHRDRDREREHDRARERHKESHKSRDGATDGEMDGETDGETDGGAETDCEDERRHCHRSSSRSSRYKDKIRERIRRARQRSRSRSRSRSKSRSRSGSQTPKGGSGGDGGRSRSQRSPETPQPTMRTPLLPRTRRRISV